MTVAEFRSRVEPGMKLSVDGKDFVIKEVIKFRLDDGSFYFKCFLNDGYVIADDLSENTFLLVKEIKTLFQPPFSSGLDFTGKKFRLIFTAHATAEEIHGEDIFKQGDSERFWDYQVVDGSYLSLGFADSTKERFDFYGKIVANDTIKLA
ncbi:DUF4178 domain-containing protein [Patescibacteria group bacterium]|nr:DUF4178 domain-containing protein [Patescibacteria group bacterium]